MTDDFDVIVVGARCAGSPLAASLAARGLRVCLVDRARFPSDVPSTHMIQPSGLACLGRLGLLDSVLATGAPPLTSGMFVIDDARLEFGPTVTEHFEAPWLCVRRIVLDALLIEAAGKAGAEVRTETTVTGLVEDNGVVRGIRTAEGELTARLVIGADGPRSTIARLVGAREYHVTAPGRLFQWAYFEGDAAPSGHARLGQIGDVGFLAMPCDNGLYMAGVAPSMARRDACMADVEGTFRQALAGVGELDDFLRPATRVGPIRVMARWHSYFREAAGPGWALVGDAGICKDPTPAQGISDALRQAEKLAETIDAGMRVGELTHHLSDWWRWRDEDAWDMYWFANDMGAAGSIPGMAVEIIRGLSRERDGAEKFLRVLNHDASPSSLFNPNRGLRTLVRTAVTRPWAVPGLALNVRSLVADESRRQRLHRQPEFAPRPRTEEAPVALAE
jgi:2-polyprenyl-6-methoxyphenol hydroxylase-like FAD-dependent oxidoreductase